MCGSGTRSRHAELGAAQSLRNDGKEAARQGAGKLFDLWATMGFNIKKIKCDLTSIKNEQKRCNQALFLVSGSLLKSLLKLMQCFQYI